MFKNKIYYLNNMNFTVLGVKETWGTETFVAEINGSQVKNYNQFLMTMWELFDFPYAQFANYDGYLDWIRDLDWLNKQQYVLIIYDFNEFLEEDLVLKNEIVEDFIEIILPWWQEEVEHCVVGGRARSFNVYLVD